MAVMAIIKQPMRSRKPPLWFSDFECGALV